MDELTINMQYSGTGTVYVLVPVLYDSLQKGSNFHTVIWYIVIWMLHLIISIGINQSVKQFFGKRYFPAIIRNSTVLHLKQMIYVHCLRSRPKFL